LSKRALEIESKKKKSIVTSLYFSDPYSIPLAIMQQKIVYILIDDFNCNRTRYAYNKEICILHEDKYEPLHPYI